MSRRLLTNQISTVNSSKRCYFPRPLTLYSQVGVLGIVQFHSGVSYALSCCFVVVDLRPVLYSFLVQVFYRLSVLQRSWNVWVPRPLPTRSHQLCGL